MVRSRVKRKPASRRAEFRTEVSNFFLEGGEGLLGIWQDIVGILMLALAIASVLALLGLSVGAWTGSLADLLFTWLGWGAVLFPVSIGLISLVLLARSFGWLDHVKWRRVIALELSVVFLLGLVHLALAAELAKDHGISQSDVLAGRQLLLHAVAGQGGGKVGWAVVLLASSALPRSPVSLLALLFTIS